MQELFLFLLLVVDTVPLSFQFLSTYREMLITCEVSCAVHSEAEADQVHAQRTKHSLTCKGNHLHFQMHD